MGCLTRTLLVRGCLSNPAIQTPAPACRLPEGAAVTINGVNFTISYAGGTNSNDVVLSEGAGTTLVEINAGNLLITDANGGDTNDTLAITRLSVPIASASATQITS